ncbi:MAG: urea ABC transporter permease subunit UrtB [Alphaproteobacteria bacterium]|nr:urea ABC transporter permease subunit UrtB [Alphaproteobacteria bacterium]
MSQSIVVVLNALTLISILALVAIGLAVIFGMMDVMNLAHGEFVTIGAYTLSFVQSLRWLMPPGSSYWLALLIAPVVGALFGLLIEWAVIRRLYHRPLDTILATFGVSLILQKSIELTFGALPQIVVAPVDGMVGVLGAAYPSYRLLIIVIACLVVGGTLAVFRYTQFGVDLRAVIQNRAMAESLGIDAKRLTRIAFAGGAALASLAGVLLAPLASVEAHLGTFYMGKAFFVVILGGIGSVVGSVAGSVLVGGAETLLNYQLDPSLASALVLALAIVLVRLRPRGIVPGYSAAHELLGKG